MLLRETVAYPIPVPDGVPGWLVVTLSIAAGAAVFVVLLWQAVRYFRQNRDDDPGGRP